MTSRRLLCAKRVTAWIHAAEGKGQGGKRRAWSIAWLSARRGALLSLQVEVLHTIAEFMATPGDVGRPPAVLAKEFPQVR